MSFPAIPSPTLQRHTKITELVEENTGISLSVAKLVADLVLDPSVNMFGKKEWIDYFGVGVGEREPPAEFYRFWHGPDPFDPDKAVSETHFDPVFCPQSVTQISTNSVYPYHLQALRRLACRPQLGFPSRYLYHSEALTQNELIQAESACWLVLRKGAFDQAQWEKDVVVRTNAGYEKKPSALHLATVAIARRIFTGERPLSDHYALCSEIVRYGKGTSPMIVGKFSPGGDLDVDDSIHADYNALNVVALKTF